MMTTSRNVHFSTAKLAKDMKKGTLVMSIEQVIRGCKIQTILGDRQLKAHTTNYGGKKHK